MNVWPSFLLFTLYKHYFKCFHLLQLFSGELSSVRHCTLYEISPQTQRIIFEFYGQIGNFAHQLDMDSTLI